MTMATPAGTGLADVLSRIAQIQTLIAAGCPALPTGPDPLALFAGDPGGGSAPVALAAAPLTGGADAPASGAAVASFPQALANAAGATYAAPARPAAALGSSVLASSTGGAGGVSDTAFLPPLPGATITQPFGPTSFTLEPPATVNGVHYAHYHDGVDLAAPLGTPVHAAASGRVVEAGRAPDGAVVVAIQHADGTMTRYAHLEPDLPVRVGAEVRAGDVIGSVGLTGETTGPHLHFELWRNGTTIDPMPWLQAGHLPGAPAGSAIDAGSGGVASAGTGVSGAPGASDLAAPDNGDASAAAVARFGQVAADIPYGTQIETAAARAGLDPFLLAALVKTESGFDPSARSAAGAQGLTQLMPATSQELGVRDPFDAQQNLAGGARYLKGDLQQFGSVDLALAAYLDGRGAVEAAGGVPDDAGTHAYIDRVVGAWNGLLEEKS